MPGVDSFDDPSDPFFIAVALAGGVLLLGGHAKWVMRLLPFALSTFGVFVWLPALASNPTVAWCVSWVLSPEQRAALEAAGLSLSGTPRIFTSVFCGLVGAIFWDSVVRFAVVCAMMALVNNIPGLGKIAKRVTGIVVGLATYLFGGSASTAVLQLPTGATLLALAAEHFLLQPDAAHCLSLALACGPAANPVFFVTWSACAGLGVLQAVAKRFGAGAAADEDAVHLHQQ